MGSGISSDFPTGTNEEEYLQLIAIAERTKRYDDMCKFVQKLVDVRSTKGKTAINSSERQALSLAFKGAISSRRNTMGLLLQQPESPHVNAYRKIILGEMETIYRAVVDISEILITGTTNEEIIGFHRKMNADFARYLAEAEGSSEDCDWSAVCIKGYDDALKAVSGLPTLNDVKLGIILNRSVTVHEVMHDTNAACEMASVAIQEAEHDPGFNDAKAKNARGIVKLLKDNIEMWMKEKENDPDDPKMEEGDDK